MRLFLLNNEQIVPGLSGFRSQSRSSSRQDYRDNNGESIDGPLHLPYPSGYRVESPSSNFSRRENGHQSNGAAGNNGESRTESVRSVRIERKTQY